MPAIDPITFVRRSLGGTLKPALCAAALVLATFPTLGLCAAIDDVRLLVRSNTGQVWLYNSGTTSVGFVYYSINSAGSALAPAQWTSIADNYDASGDGSVDPDHEWSELSNVSAALSEGSFLGPGGTLDADQAVSLGAIWDHSVGRTDLGATIVETGQIDPSPLPITLAGDFDNDLDVDLVDLGLWRSSFLAGSGGGHGQGDANLDGNIDGADFLIWQQDAAYLASMGSSSGAGISLAAVSAAVPEPASVWLIWIAAAGLMGLKRSQRSRASTTC